MFQFFHPICTTVLCPFLLLTILNFRIYRRSKLNQFLIKVDVDFYYRFLSFGFTIAQGKDVQMTKILLTVVLTFLLLNLPRLILGIFEISRWDLAKRPWSLLPVWLSGSGWWCSVSSPPTAIPLRSGSSWWISSPGTLSSSTAASTLSSTVLLGLSSDLFSLQLSSLHTPEM